MNPDDVYCCDQLIADAFSAAAEYLDGVDPCRSAEPDADLAGSDEDP